MTAPVLSPGLTHRKSITVEKSLTVPQVPEVFAEFTELPAVFATVYLVATVEATCIAAIRPHLADGWQSVGTHVDVSHTAATPVGMAVTVDAELIEVDGRRLRFVVECRDDREVIGTGYHERHLIHRERFDERVAGKAVG